jgi:hypothetical protein
MILACVPPSMPADSFETHLTPGSALAAIGLPALLSLGLDGSISNGTQLLESIHEHIEQRRLRVGFSILCNLAQLNSLVHRTRPIRVVLRVRTNHLQTRFYRLDAGGERSGGKGSSRVERHSSTTGDNSLDVSLGSRTTRVGRIATQVPHTTVPAWDG